MPGSVNLYKVRGTVVLLTPQSAEARWTPGVGVEFEQSETTRRLREMINQLLADMPDADRCTRVL